MKKRFAIVLVTTMLAVPLMALTLRADPAEPSGNQDSAPNFGGAKDVAFAKKLWTAMDGYQDWKLTTEVYKGASPHGKWLRLYSTWVTVDGKHFPIIVKENYGGRGVTKEAVDENPDQWLAAVTIMLQREQGYDDDNDNWFWVKYGKNGEVLKNPKDMLLAGRVAKGMPAGCIACHGQAGGGDYLFSND